MTDECRAILDGPNDFARGWVLNDLPTPTIYKRQQGESGVMFWAGIVDSKLVEPFRVMEGIKMISENFWTGHHLSDRKPVVNCEN